jgi:hypothetical protein
LFSRYSEDVLALVTPTSYQELAPAALRHLGQRWIGSGNQVENESYFGLPLLAALCWLWRRYRRRAPAVAAAAVFGGVAIVITWGQRLHVAGREPLSWLPLPYSAIRSLPAINGVLATRFAALAYLAAGVVLGIGLDRLHSERLRWRSSPLSARGRSWACGGLAVVALVPLLPAPPYATTPAPVPAFFRTRALVEQIPAGSVVLPYPEAEPLALPFDVRSMLWQAEAAMRFRMIGVYGPVPVPLDSPPAPRQRLLAPLQMQLLEEWAYYGAPQAAPPPAPGPAELTALRVFLATYRVSTILVQRVGAHPDVLVDYLRLALGARPVEEGGITAWFGVPGLLAAR